MKTFVSVRLFLTQLRPPQFFTTAFVLASNLKQVFLKRLGSTGASLFMVAFLLGCSTSNPIKSAAQETVYPFAIKNFSLTNLTGVYWTGEVLAPSISGSAETYQDCWHFTTNTDGSVSYEWRSQIYRPQHGRVAYFPETSNRLVASNYFTVRHDITNTYLDNEAQWRNAKIVLEGYKKSFDNKSFSNRAMSQIFYFKNFQRTAGQRKVEFNFGSRYDFQENSIFPSYPGYKKYDRTKAEKTLIADNAGHAIEVAGGSSIFEGLWASYTAIEGDSSFPAGKCPTAP